LSKNAIKRSKTATAIAILLIISIGASLTLLPTANAHTPPWQIPTHAKIAVSVNPIGVGQTLNIYMWLGNLPVDGSALTNDYRYHNYKLTITAPDGTVQTQTWVNITDPTNSQYLPFTPTQVGTYALNFTFAGFAVNDFSHLPTSTYVNDTYLSSSVSTTLTVQQEPLPAPINSYPLPQEYWTRPIYGENTDWWSISSNWLGSGSSSYSGMIGPGMKRFPGDAIGPRTGHIMWTKPLQSGGVVGGNNFPIQGNTYFEGSAYVQRFNNPIIVNGKLYYTEPLSFYSETSLAGAAFGPTDCVDIRTGQLVWSRADVPPLSFAYIYDLEDPQQHGVYPAILFASAGGFGAPTVWRAFDADTGNPLFNVTAVPSGTAVIGPQGELLRYVLANAGNSTNPDWRLAQWNSTKLWSGLGFSGNLPNQWVPTISGIVDASNSIGVNSRYDWNISIPWYTTVSPAPSVVAGFYNDLLILRNGSLGVSSVAGKVLPYTYFAVNLNASKGTIGSVLWWNTVTPQADILQISYGGADPVNRVFLETYRDTSNWIGYSMETGQKIWGPTPPQADFDYYGSPGPGTLANVIAYGKLYSSAYAGILYAYDIKTGNLLWTYGNGGPGNSTNSGGNGGFANYPTFINAVGNGIIYLVTTEHTVQTPIYKGSVVRAVDAETGKEIWTLSDYTGEFGSISFAIADGFATYFNGYDNQIYSIGRGPSSTSIAASPKVSTYGGSVLIEGTVMDISAGTKQNEQAARFPNGVPAVSDDGMKDWMGYVYQQKPRPTEVTGVSVTLSVLDANNNFREIGKTTSSTDGFYSLMWTPDIPGKYTVYASFAGSESYWPSHASTAFAVDPAPEAPPVVEPQPLPPTEMYVTGAAIAIIIAVAVTGAILAMLLKRRP
jgi:outer membrane protein assembly factor BamB